MNVDVKKSLLAAALAGTLITGAALVSAQQDSAQQDSAQTEQSEMSGERTGRGHGFGARRGPGLGGAAFGDRDGARAGFRGGVPGLGRLSLGSSVELQFYDGDPSAGGTLETRLTHVVGEDSEVAFREAFEAARTDAAYLVVEVSEQTQTFDLATARQDENGRGGHGLGSIGMRGLGSMTEGSSVSATFYDGDPEAGGTVLETLNFAYVEDSARGFSEELMNAAEDAAFVTITVSPQEYTLNLSDMPDPDALGGRGLGPRRNH